VQSLAVAARAYILEQGEIVLSGPAFELRDNPDLKRAYLGM
jgi:branched-chain amino acid transport system ATP-binding protein